MVAQVDTNIADTNVSKIVGNDQYVITADMTGILEILAEANDWQVELNEIVEEYHKNVLELLHRHLPQLEITLFEEQEIKSYILSEVLKLPGDTNVICLDRFLYRFLAKQGIKNLYKLSISRSIEGKKVSRIGEAAIVDQLTFLEACLRGKKVVLIDDGIFSGGTVNELILKFQNAGIEVV